MTATHRHLLPAIILYLLTGLLWLALIWNPRPQIIQSGDGGNVSAIAAGWLARDRFAADPVLATPQASRFYMALSVPATMLIGSALSDIGSGYVVQIAALVGLQLLGFHLLGLRLFGKTRFAVALALISLPPVYLIGGSELWGQYDLPLSRSFAGAVLPFILLLLTDDRNGVYRRPLLVMAACGACVYLHPVSAPAIAAGCLFALAIDRDPTVAWLRHLLGVSLGALVCAIIALPFAFTFLGAFPGFGAEGDPERALAASALRMAAGALYFDLPQLLHGLTSSWGWRWFMWAGGVVGLVAMVFSGGRTRRLAMLLLAFLTGVLFASVGLTAIDQWLASLGSGTPRQIDLIRNVRFVVPLLLTSLTGLFWAVDRRLPPAAGWGTFAVLALAVVAWWQAHPTPISRAFAGTTPIASIDADASARLLHWMRNQPPRTRVLPLAPVAQPNSPIEVAGLAVRYSAFQPVMFLEKDINLLSYSSSSNVGQWLRLRERVGALRQMPPVDAGSAVLDLLRQVRADLLLLYEPDVPDPLLGELRKLGPVALSAPPWLVIDVRRPISGPR